MMKNCQSQNETLVGYEGKLIRHSVQNVAKCKGSSDAPSELRTSHTFAEPERSGVNSLDSR